jgi:hypothetical protein
MSDSSGAPALVLRVSAPVTDMSRSVVQELAAKVAGHVGDPDPEGRAVADAVARVTEDVTSGAREPADDVTIEFTRAPGALLIQARCAGRTADARHPLPA